MSLPLERKRKWKVWRPRAGGGSAAGGLRILKSEEHVGGGYISTCEGTFLNLTEARHGTNATAAPRRHATKLSSYRRSVEFIDLSIFLVPSQVEMELRQEAA